MRAIFIRHGESTGNAGMPCTDLAMIELTKRGQEQARHVAASWTDAPALIVTSPYIRTRQTAAPTIARFPDVSVDVWPIEEFTYLQPARWNGTRSAERMPHLERYWSEADPAYCDGEGRRASPPCYAAAKRRWRGLPPCRLNRWSMCSGMGDSFRPRARSSPTPIWMTGARCSDSGARGSRPRSATRSG